ncbi:unnamed protein product [Blepharisma stoltei]|uniref:Uncharacterized protein n=1 Tax=Blepharisma stoltei TaxID=1481888 RepID=A0AAU9IT12_9CILI|nr:unnamed protein product [Blepharisma stoltei]
MRRYRPRSSASQTSKDLLLERSLPSPFDFKEKTQAENELEFELKSSGNFGTVEDSESSRKRTLDLLETQTQNFNKDLEDQLIARDHHINELNNSILMLRTIVKIKEDEISQLKNTNLMESESRDSIENYKKQIEEYRKSDCLLSSEKEKLKKEIEETKEKIAELKSQLEIKESSQNEIKKDIKEISEVFTRMSSLNSELQEKVEKLSEELQETYRKYYEAEIKAKFADKLQLEIDSIIKSKSKLKRENTSYLATQESIKEKLSQANEAILAYEEMLNSLLADLKSEEYLENKLKSAAQFCIDFQEMNEKLKNSLNSADFHQENNNQKNEEIKNAKIEQLEEENSKQRIQITELNEKIETLQLEIDTLTRLNQKLKSDFLESTSKIKNQFNIIKSQNDKYKDQRKQAIAERDTKDIELQEMKIRLAHASEKIEKIREHNRTLNEKISQMQHHHANSQSETLPLDIYKNSKELAYNEVLREEIFKKDTELVRKSKDILRLEKELKELKDTIIQAKSQINEDEYQNILDDKDKEIEILKGMLKGAYSETRVKEGKLFMMRRKLGNISDKLGSMTDRNEHTRQHTTLI